MKLYCFVALSVASALFALWIGGWVLFLEPIVDAFMKLQSEQLTPSIIIGTVVKCIIAGPVGCAIYTFLVRLWSWILD